MSRPVLEAVAELVEAVTNSMPFKKETYDWLKARVTAGWDVRAYTHVGNSPKNQPQNVRDIAFFVLRAYERLVEEHRERCVLLAAAISARALAGHDADKIAGALNRCGCIPVDGTLWTAGMVLDLFPEGHRIHDQEGT